MNLYEAIKNNIQVDYDKEDIGELEECRDYLKLATYYDTKDIKDINLRMDLADSYEFTLADQIEEYVEPYMTESLYKQYKKATSKIKGLTEKKRATIKFINDAIRTLEHEPKEYKEQSANIFKKILELASEVEPYAKSILDDNAWLDKALSKATEEASKYTKSEVKFTLVNTTYEGMDSLGACVKEFKFDAKDDRLGPMSIRLYLRPLDVEISVSGQSMNEIEKDFNRAQKQKVLDKYTGLLNELKTGKYTVTARIYVVNPEWSKIYKEYITYDPKGNVIAVNHW